MKNNKKIVNIVGALSIGALALTGCKKSDPAPEDNGGAEADAGAEASCDGAESSCDGAESSCDGSATEGQ